MGPSVSIAYPSRRRATATEARCPSTSRSRTATASSHGGSAGATVNTPRGIDPQAEHRPQQELDRPGRPGLGRAAHRVGHRGVAGGAVGPFEPAVQLRQPGQVVGRGGIDQRGGDPVGGVGEPVAVQPGRDQAVVAGPDRAVVAAHRVEGGFPRAAGADAPAGIHIRPVIAWRQAAVYEEVLADATAGAAGGRGRFRERLS